MGALDKRIKTNRLILKMQKDPEFSEKLGLQNKSYMNIQLTSKEELKK